MWKITIDWILFWVGSALLLSVEQSKRAGARLKFNGSHRQLRSVRIGRRWVALFFRRARAIGMIIYGFVWFSVPFPIALSCSELAVVASMLLGGTVRPSAHGWLIKCDHSLRRRRSRDATCGVSLLCSPNSRRDETGWCTSNQPARDPSNPRLGVFTAN